MCELISVIGTALCSSLGFHVDKAFWLPFLVGKPFMMILNGAERSPVERASVDGRFVMKEMAPLG